MKRFCIFSGGEIYDYSVVSIHENDIVMCADSGLYHANKIGIIPDIVAGDFDSYFDDISFKCTVIRCKPEKDDTDTMMCVKYALSHEADEIVIYGGLSGRLDHTFANIQTLRYCVERNVMAVIDDGLNKSLVQTVGRAEYQQNKGYFSVFALTDKLMIKELSGVKYPLKDYSMTSDFPIGVSNEIIENAVLEISEGYALIIFSKK